MAEKFGSSFYGMREVEHVKLYRAKYTKYIKQIKQVCQNKFADKFEQIALTNNSILLYVKPGLQKVAGKKQFVLLFQQLKEDLAYASKDMEEFPAFSQKGEFRLPLFFPTGKIYIVTENTVKNEDLTGILRNYPGKIVKSYKKLPIKVFQLQPDYIHIAGQIAIELEHQDRIQLASADFHALDDKKNIQPESFQGTWQQLYSNNAILRKSYVFRAWEFGEGTPGVNVAVIDKNFSDHPNLTYRLAHGYDAADGGNDPRQPKAPESFDENSQPVYESTWEHGTAMCGVIAGNKLFTPPHLERGCAANAEIVPIRPSFITNANQPDQPGYVDSWLANQIDAMIQIFYSGAAVVNHSGTTVIWNNNEINNTYKSWLRWLCQPAGGPGVFYTASSGNTPPATEPVAYPSNLLYTFSVGWGDRDTDAPLGKIGTRLDITVPDGYWGAYLPGGGGVSFEWPGGGGTSVACAVAAGTGILVASQGFNRQSRYTSAEISEIIRRTARTSPAYLTGADENGHSNQFGYGWIDAFAAVKLAHKGRMAAGQPIPIHFLHSPSICVLIPQRGDIQGLGAKPWFWCLLPKSDNDGLYWGHWQPNHTWAIDITAGGKPPGMALVVADFNGDGLDEIAVQQAGARRHRFFIIQYKTNIGQWQRMGAGRDADGSALVWGSAAQSFDQIIAADVDGDGKMELVASRNHGMDMAKYDAAADQWIRFGPPMYKPKKIDERLVNTGRYTILNKDIQLLRLNRLHREGVHQDLILATAVVRVELGVERWGGLISDVERIEYHCVCSLQRYLGNKWVSQQIDEWGTTHIPITYTNNIITADIDGDKVEEAVYFVKEPEKKIIVIDFAKTLPAPTGHHGYLKIDSPWVWEGDPVTLFPGDFDGDGCAELAYLESDESNDIVRFIKWDPFLRRWYNWKTMNRKKLGNPAIELATGDFDGDGQAEIGLLLEKPFANTYHVFKLISDRFTWMGDL